MLLCVQAAAEVAAEDAARLSELSKQLSKETAELAKLRASCDGLQKKAAALQVCPGGTAVTLLMQLEDRDASNALPK